MTETQRKTVVIGIGNASCGDDAVGVQVARQLKEKGNLEMAVVEESGEPTSLMAAMKGYERVILVDAILGHGALGAMHMIDASKSPLPAELFSHYSTHSFGLVESIELARALGELPLKVLVIGIEGGQFEPGDEMSEQVQSSIGKAVDWILYQSENYSYAESR